MVDCPNDLDLGGGIKNEFHNKFGWKWIDSKIETKYKIKLIDCGLKPDYFKKEQLETLTAGFPLYLLSGTTDSDGNQMAMTVDPADKYAPR